MIVTFSFISYLLDTKDTGSVGNVLLDPCSSVCVSLHRVGSPVGWLNQHLQDEIEFMYYVGGKRQAINQVCTRMYLDSLFDELTDMLGSQRCSPLPDGLGLPGTLGLRTDKVIQGTVGPTLTPTIKHTLSDS